jgi:hypothetical protein
MNVWTRRGALRSGVALLAGAVGLEVVGRARDGGAEPLPLPLPLPAAPRTATTVTLHARHLRAVPVGGRPGMPVENGARLTLLADLVDARGAVVGSLTGVSHCTAAPLSSDDSPVGAVEMHTLSLRDGTILAMGTAPAVAWGHRRLRRGRGHRALRRGDRQLRRRAADRRRGRERMRPLHPDAHRPGGPSACRLTPS